MCRRARSPPRGWKKSPLRHRRHRGRCWVRPPGAPAVSPQVDGEGRGEDEAQQHQERQPGLQKPCTAGVRETKLTSRQQPINNTPSADAVWWLRSSSPHVFPVDQREEAELDHVPRCAVLVSHQVQRHGNVRVTVIAAEVVLLGKEWGDEHYLGVKGTEWGQRTILCLYSSEASWTAISQALEPLA